MNKKWKKFKTDYVPNMIAAIICFTILFFIIALFKYSWKVSLIRSFSFATCVTILLWGLGFYHEEIYKAKVRLKKLKSILSPALDKLGFSIVDESYLEGTFAKYLARIYWYKSTNPNQLEETTIQIFFVKETKPDLNELTKKFTELNLHGGFKFDPGIFYFKTLALATSEVASYNLEKVISLLSSFGFNHIDYKSWKEKYWTIYEANQKQIEESQTKKRLKLFGGKLDIKLTKH